ncbi:SDR family NAD(P)-dependent oxidoreductase [Kutzneria sp. NPDC052558]|uniref:SDR family NAD(P)-dependent oxidoreductase n=1 Tax=Kutzneria sp. NPDC052558 TaxID=3364121 RepID=UPI0037CA38E2
MVAAVARGGGLGVFDGCRPPEPEMARAPFGIRVPAGSHVDTRGAAIVLFEPGAPIVPSGALAIAQVRSLDEATAAIDAGADGLVAMDDGDLSAFVLLQQLLQACGGEVPVWAYAVGPRTAVGAMAAGASGVFLDEQLRMLPDADTSGPERERLLRADSSLATLFARRYRDTEHAVRSLAAAVRERPVVAGQGIPLCRTLGSALPIAQGPMTRVSDQPAFAAEVADQGGFPFIAVATASGAGTADLLDRTRDRLGDRPWGVGLLGFIDPDLRDQQLAAVRAARPHCALLAGGKPAQAKVLEADGIPTYVHVPSPVLLKQFLDAGVRRFVFEGAECGGHIGPRPSFALWEQQLDVLRGYGPGIEVLFAGGVHDARSAAVVAGAAAELAASGAGIGVLMGTAYLFTREAVATGAITDLFQDLAIDAGETTILETAPGHRTRCLPSLYTAHFEIVKNDLRSVPELSAQQVWQQLEELNTGRLRIASKGLQHSADGPVTVGPDTQLSQGLYMAGQVAVLRDAKTTIAELHDSVTEGVRRLLESSPDGEPEPGRDIAIVGMACSFPGAPDLPAYWSQILRGTDAVTEVPADRWDTNVYPDLPGWGGFLPPLDFDPLTYGMPPSSMGSIDPAQLVSLELARRALADAGYADRDFDRDRTSVIFGAESGSDLGNAKVMRGLLPSYVDEAPPELLDQLPSLTEDSFPGTLANVISGRIANRLDLRGANFTVDAACGSSLAALDIAVKELRSGTSSMVLCGAVDLHNGVNDYLMFTSAGALSPTGRCRPFDSAADGIALGEGVACVVLKRLADAERDGDRVYAVVKGVGAASDGKALGLTAPRPEGQRRALERAYQDARSSPGDVRLVEAHGTGTVVGDATELRTLTEFFADAGVAPASIALGSVKSQIGHTKCAAGLAGLIKATLALWHEVVPPTLHLSSPNSAWQADTSPFTFSTAARPAPGLTGLAGVSAFGFGGTNFHAVLGPGPVPPDRRHGLRDWSRELVLVRGSDVDSARESLRALADEQPNASLRELAEDVASVNADAPVRLAFVAADRESLTAGGIAAKEPAGKIAFLFPGQGSQQPGMLAELFVHFPELADVLRHAPAVVPAVYPPHAFDEERLAAQLAAVTDTAVAQPALGLVESALCRLLAELGVKPDFLAGHSYGELVALSEAGAFTLSTLVELSAARARAIADASRERPGAMAAVRATREVLAAELAGMDISLANHNAPEQIIVSGSVEEIERCVRHLRAKRIATKRIAVSAAFHSPLVAPAEGAFAASLDVAAIEDPVLPVWSNTSGRRYAPGAVRQVLAAQIPAPVRFVDQIEDMYAAGARTFVEVGPGQTLTRLVREILGDRPHAALPCGPGIREFLGAVGRLAVAGVPVDTARLFRGRPRPTPRPDNAWTVTGNLVRRPDGQLPPHGLAPARRIPRIAMTEATPVGRDQVVVEFLRNSRELITTQREVMLGYLGAVPAVRYALPEVVDAAHLTAVSPAPVVQPAVNGKAVAPAVIAAPAAEPAPPADVRTAVLDVISDRTGFPPDMIEGDLDLEADLSIDSIKRTEIAGTLLRRLGLTDAAGDDGPDLLVRQRTANAITTQLEQWLTPAHGTAGAPNDGEPHIAIPTSSSPLRPGGEEPTIASASPAGSAPRRYVLHLVDNPLPPPDPARLSGKTLAVLSAPGQDELADSVRRAFGLPTAAPADADITVSLHGMADSVEPAAPELFTQLKAAKGTFIALATRDALGLSGLFRAAALERDATTRLVVVDSPRADVLVAEAMVDDGHAVVHHTAEGRMTHTVREQSLGSLAHSGAGPGGGELAALGLGPDSVVAVIGGARGITARAAVALAASGCRVEFTGRTPWPGDDDLPEDPRALREALIARGGSIADIERQARTVLAQREISRTLAEVGNATYHVLDVRDGEAVRQFVKQLGGRLDGVLYAAGVIDDKLMSDKDETSFRTVFDTKVAGARTLLSALADEGLNPGFLAFFGSISAVLGNRGQTDYAAGNDALETLAAQWPGRAVTVHWGPWAPADDHSGMVTPELAREYQRREVAMIDPTEGTAALLRELAYGDVPAVLYTAALW